MKAAFSLFCISYCCALLSAVDIVPYADGMSITQGSVYDEVDPLVDKTANGFFQVTSNNNNGQVPVSKITLDLSFQKNETELASILSINVDAEASLGLSSWDTHVGYLRNYNFSGKTLTATIRVRKRWVGPAAKNIALSADGLKYLKLASQASGNNKMLTLRKIMGSHVVTSETRGAEIYLIYKFNFYRQEDAQTIEANNECRMDGWQCRCRCFVKN